jgi:glycosyltransferase involved in cell wall biosynthesis
MISRYFPPRFDVGGKRAYRFARYLPEFGWRAVVLTGSVPTGRRLDPTPLDLPEQTRVDRTYEPKWFKEPPGRPSDGTTATPVRTRPPKKRRFPRVFDMPIGPELMLVPHVVREATRLCREEKVDAVFATSSPYVVLIQGAKVAERTGLPLCLDLRDPWSLNFLMQGRGAWARWGEKRMEQRLFEQANRVILNNETALAAYRDLYGELPEDRLCSIRNAFDPADRPPAQQGPMAGPIRLLHFGNCYGPRRLETMLRAMRLVQERRPDAPKVVLENLGRVGTADVELAEELGLRDAFEYGVFVPFEEGLRKLAAADLAVLVAYGDETLYIPAKLYDYLLARAPIACIAQPGELSRIVESSGAGQALAPGDVEAAAVLIDRAIDARAEGRPAFVPDEARLEEYSARAASKRLAAVLDAISGGS